MISPLLQAVARVVMPLALLVALWLLGRGHHLPGGGFVAGLVVAAAVILQYVATGRRLMQEAVRVPSEALVAIGLLVVVGTGLGAQVATLPFLTSAHGHLHLPLLGDFPLSSAGLFDVGVFLVVTGSTLRILLAIEE
ncbi:MAG: hypothetical protein KIT14_01315 [bacterium]|nr:hypothetical protein [bacterium]